jgi:hypothetical protein
MLAQRFARTAVTMVGGPKESLARCFVGVFTRSRYSDKNGTSRSTPTPEKGAPTPCTKERQRAERPSLCHGLAVHVRLHVLSVRANVAACAVCPPMPSSVVVHHSAQSGRVLLDALWVGNTLCEGGIRETAFVRALRALRVLLCSRHSSGLAKTDLEMIIKKEGRHLNQKSLVLFLFGDSPLLVAKHFCPLSVQRAQRWLQAGGAMGKDGNIGIDVSARSVSIPPVPLNALDVRVDTFPTCCWL